MKVYIVVSGEQSEGCSIINVRFTIEKARKVIQRLASTSKNPEKEGECIWLDSVDYVDIIEQEVL